VTENIAAFGGDPVSVTIVGESAGASSVAALLVMPRRAA
jgi:para-nitrobenzyl esterase